MLFCNSKHIRYIVAEPKIRKRLFDMLARYRFLCFLLTDFVGLGGDESDELDAAFDKEVARVFGKGLS